MTTDTLFKMLDKLNLSSKEDLLLLAPKGITNYKKNIEDVFEGFEYCGPAMVLDSFKKHPSKSIWQLNVDIKGVKVTISVFGNFKSIISQWGECYPYQKVYVKGTFEKFGSCLYLSGAKKVPDQHFNKIIVNYKSINKVASSDEIREAILNMIANKDTLNKAITKIQESLGEQCESYGFLEQLIWSLHVPNTENEFYEALDYAKNLSIRSLIVKKDQPKIENIDSQIILDWFDVVNMIDGLPYQLSESQLFACDGIAQELESSYAMNALLSGDVGTGKTIVYLLMAIAVQKCQKRVAILAPNLPLANQIATELGQLFPEIAYLLVTGSNKINFDDKDNPILIGTTALISFAKKHNWKADFIVIDEQQKFSDEQKLAITHEATNTLEATATCIPKTLGLVSHGNMKVFRLKGHANKIIHTQVVGDIQKRELFNKIHEVIQEGNKVVIIYPKLNTAEEDFKNNVVAAARKWDEYFPGKVVLLHGGLSDSEKKEALDLAKSGKKPIVVSTSIIEVGITIPKLRLGIVVGADKYGVSTLHQMRGRLARDGGEGYFYIQLPYDINGRLSNGQQQTIERLRLLEQTNDGFKLAELDAHIRGFGEILKEKGAQHGKTVGVFSGINITLNDIKEFLFEG